MAFTKDPVKKQAGRDAREGTDPPITKEGEVPEEMPEGYFHPDQVTQAENQQLVEEEGYPKTPVVGEPDPPPLPEVEGAKNRDKR